MTIVVSAPGPVIDLLEKQPARSVPLPRRRLARRIGWLAPTADLFVVGLAFSLTTVLLEPVDPAVVAVVVSLWPLLLVATRGYHDHGFGRSARARVMAVGRAGVCSDWVATSPPPSRRARPRPVSCYSSPSWSRPVPPVCGWPQRSSDDSVGRTPSDTAPASSSQGRSTMCAVCSPSYAEAAGNTSR